MILQFTNFFNVFSAHYEQYVKKVSFAWIAEMIYNKDFQMYWGLFPKDVQILMGRKESWVLEIIKISGKGRRGQ